LIGKFTKFAEQFSYLYCEDIILGCSYCRNFI
jgi:hypothetical protein